MRKSILHLAVFATEVLVIIGFIFGMLLWYTRSESPEDGVRRVNQMAGILANPNEVENFIADDIWNPPGFIICLDRSWLCYSFYQHTDSGWEGHSFKIAVARDNAGYWYKGGHYEIFMSDKNTQPANMDALLNSFGSQLKPFNPN
jgi:hypothetical protein